MAKMYLTDYNKKCFTQAGVTEYHKYTDGEGATVVLLDAGNYPKYYDKYEFESPFANTPSRSESAHAGKTLALGRLIVPRARIIVLSEWNMESFDWIVKHKNEIDVINVSMSEPRKENTDPKYNKIKGLGIPIVCSSGNQYRDGGLPYPAAYDYAIAVGAVTSKDHIQPYSNQGKDLDIMGYTSIDIKHNNSNILGYDGTSCSSPFVAYSIALMISYLKKNIKKVPNREEIRKLLHNNAKDIYDEGFDTSSGYGVIRLPSPEELLKITTDCKSENEDNKNDKNTTEGSVDVKFLDVKKEDWFYDSVKYVIDKGIMKGKSDTVFDPRGVLTRAEFATAIRNLLESK